MSPTSNRFNAAGTICLASLLALRKYNESGIARGMVIALSLVFLINAICGIVWMH